MNIVQLKTNRVLVLSIACIVVAVPLLWYSYGDRIALVYQVVYFGSNGETSDTSASAIDRNSAVMSPSDFKSAMIFDGINQALDADGEDLVKNVKGIFAFKVKADKGVGTWIVDAKNGRGKVEFNGKAKPDVTFQASDADLFDLMSGKLNPQKAFFAGKLKISGNMGMAMKLQKFQKKAEAEFEKAKL